MKTKIIQIPVTKISAVEKLLGRAIAANQTPVVKIRVSISEVKKIRKMLQL